MTDAGDEGAKMLSGEPSGVLVPLNENNGRTGSAILMGQFKGSTNGHEGNHDSNTEMRVENEFLQFTALIPPTSYPETEQRVQRPPFKNSFIRPGDKRLNFISLSRVLKI